MMIELEGKIITQSVSILVDISASLGYISPRMVELCKLKEQKFKSSTLVQLAIGEKHKVTT